MDVGVASVDGATIAPGGPLYVTGHFSDTAQFDSSLLTSVGSSDGFVARLDPATGAVDWAHRLGGASQDLSGDVVVDPQGNVQVSGTFFGPADFGGQTLLTNGRSMGFVTTLNPSGTFLETTSFGTVAVATYGTNGVAGLHIDAAGNRYVGGSFRNSATAEFPQRTVTNPASATLEAFVVKLPPYAAPQKLLSLANDGSVDGVQVANEDIIAFDGNAFRRYFDGSDVGLAGLAIDAFEIISPTEILLSFSSSGSVPGLGTVANADIVKFTATQLYDHTVGTFSMYFDASDVGLTTANENVDAIELLSDGRLLISTSGSFSVSGVSGGGEDILVFTPASLGSNTAGSWAMYFDGSDVGLSGSAENITSISVDSSGKLYLTTSGNFSVPGRSGANEDVFVFTPSSLGNNTAGIYSSDLFFDGSEYDLSGNALSSLSLPLAWMM